MSYLPCFQKDQIGEEQLELEKSLYSQAFEKIYSYLSMNSDHSQLALQLQISKISGEVRLPEEELNETIGRTLGVDGSLVPYHIERIERDYGSLRVHFSQLAERTAKLKMEDLRNYRELVKYRKDMKKKNAEREKKLGEEISEKARLFFITGSTG
ncbi:MAG: hypothetical protein V1944_00520 [Candidatus Aenigmatarchaeota archaeon]